MPVMFPQLCVWDAVVCSMFSLAGRLPSEPSADGPPPLFALFAGTARPSDSPPTFMLDFWFMHLLQPARLPLLRGRCWGLPVLERGVSMHARVSDLAESKGCSRWCVPRC